jgi:hypothetical protein
MDSREYVCSDEEQLTFAEAREIVRSSTLFTTLHQFRRVTIILRKIFFVNTLDTIPTGSK